MALTLRELRKQLEQLECKAPSAPSEQWLSRIVVIDERRHRAIVREEIRAAKEMAAEHGVATP